MENESIARVREFLRQRTAMTGNDVLHIVHASYSDNPADLTMTDLTEILRLAQNSVEAYERGYQAARMEFDESGMP